MLISAAFGRLCVETKTVGDRAYRYAQPPSGGCVLKLRLSMQYLPLCSQPPSGGCVLKPIQRFDNLLLGSQPPSGGCVLKLLVQEARLKALFQPPSGGCVLKHGTACLSGT